MTETTWDRIERRRTEAPAPGNIGGSSEAAFLGYIVNQLESINDKLEAMHTEHTAMKGDIEDIKLAFPKSEDGERDFDGHHDYHDTLIRNSKSWGEIMTDVKKKLFGGIAWATVCFVAWAIWEGIKHEVKK